MVPPGTNGGPPSGNGDRGKPRIGVFICHCGGNISDLVDVERVAAAMSRLPNVEHASTKMFMCSDPGQEHMVAMIKEHALNRVIVSACSPNLHEGTFRRVVAKAGLNPFLFEHVNVREHVSWVATDRELATQKAERLIRAAVARSRHLEPLQKRRIAIHSAALVIGGGPAGLVAARSLADRGINVTLVERQPFLGGHMAQLNTLFPTKQRARDLLTDLVRQVVTNPLVTVLTNATVTGSSGLVGNFRTSVRLDSRGVKPSCPDTGLAMSACPEEALSEFDYGLKARKAMYMSFPGCYPPLPAIDWQSCTKCAKCVAATDGQGIALDEQPRQIEVHSGVVILATGSDPYEPVYGEFGYGLFPEVITLQQLVRLLDPAGPTFGRLELHGKMPKRIAFIHCVGARQHRGVSQEQPDGRVKDYCARTCCTATLHAMEEIRELLPETKFASFYQDIRTYGRGHEDYYTRASENGVLFFRHDPFEPPEVQRDPRGKAALIVKAKDKLTGGLEVEYPADLVVLSTGVVPHNIADLAEMYRCAVGADRFLLEVHPKLRPVELAVSGVFLAGSCQGPMDITEASSAAAAAASKAAALISQGEMEMDPFIAKVDEALCSGCQTCMKVCAYEAISKNEARNVAVVSEALCTGCGTCVATCPSNAIQQYGFTDEEVYSEVMALLEVEDREPVAAG